MERKEEDVTNKYPEQQPLGTAAQTRDRDYEEPPPSPLFVAHELVSWSFYRAGIAEFIATFLFLYITVLTVMVSKADSKSSKFKSTTIRISPQQQKMPRRLTSSSGGAADQRSSGSRMSAAEKSNRKMQEESGVIWEVHEFGGKCRRKN